MNDTKPYAGSPAAAANKRLLLCPEDSRWIYRIFDLAEPLCQSESMELVHVEFQREQQGRILRVFIDKAGGVTLDDCVAISRELSDLLDVYLDEIGPYRLEVSSPGSNRPIGKVSDFERFAGHPVSVRTRRPLNGQKNFSGVIQGATEDHLELQVADKTVSISFEEITRARLINYHGEI